MKKPLRTFLFVLLVFVVVVLGLVGWFALRCGQMARTVRSAPLAAVDLNQVADGTYQGRFGDFLVSTTVEVTVAQHRITAVRVIDQHCGPGYEAKGTAERIVAAQSPVVDAVSGATGSSRCIMVAVYRALTAAR